MTRLKNLMKRAANGESLVIGFFRWFYHAGKSIVNTKDLLCVSSL